MYYVITKGGGGVRKCQFLITFSTESNHKGERGGQKTPNLDYVIHGCSPSKKWLLDQSFRWQKMFLLIKIELNRGICAISSRKNPVLNLGPC